MVFASGIIWLYQNAAFSGNPFFPETKNWRLSVDEIVYTPDNLYELIDGAADAYIAYHFVDLHIGEYTNATKGMVRIEIYRHSNSDNAFGIYASERMPDYNFLSIGTEGYISSGILNFFTGQYYVKLIWSDDEGSGDESLINFASLIEKQLNQDNRWPGILSLFPEKDKLPESEGYTPENFMGYSFFHAAFSVGYKADDNEFRLFIIENDNGDDAKVIIEKYLKSVNSENSGKEAVNYLVEDPFNGKIGISKYDRYVFGVYNLDEDSLISNYQELLYESINKQHNTK